MYLPPKGASTQKIRLPGTNVCYISKKSSGHAIIRKRIILLTDISGQCQNYLPLYFKLFYTFILSSVCT